MCSKQDKNNFFIKRNGGKECQFITGLINPKRDACFNEK